MFDCFSNEMFSIYGYLPGSMRSQLVSSSRVDLNSVDARTSSLLVFGLEVSLIARFSILKMLDAHG
jgi:hypothetical protein